MSAGPPRRIFVTGAAGVMGLRLCARLLRAGCVVRGLVLPGDPQARQLAALGVEAWTGDLCDPDSLRGSCEGVEVVYHLAAIILSRDPSAFERINLAGTANVVREAARSGVRQFVYVSSASVTYPKRTPYAESKLAAERVVAEAGAFAHTIVRPTLVYDERGGQELLLFLDYLRRFPVVPFIGDGRARKRPVWSEDVVDGLVRLLGQARAHGKTYNFSGAETIGIEELARLLLRHHRASRPFVHVPVPMCRAAARVLGVLQRNPKLTLSAISGIVNDADLDPSQAMSDLGYRPLGVREGFARCFPLESASERVSGSGSEALGHER